MLLCFCPWSFSLTQLHLFITKHPEMQIMALHCSKSSNGFSKRQRPYKGPTKICYSSLISNSNLLQLLSSLLTNSSHYGLPTVSWTYQVCSTAVCSLLSTWFAPSSPLGLYSNVTILERLSQSTLSKDRTLSHSKTMSFICFIFLLALIIT